MGRTKIDVKRTIRLTESDLHRIIAESVKSILIESGDSKRGQFMLGRVLGRAHQRGDFGIMKDVHDRIGPLKQDHNNPAHWGYIDQTGNFDATNAIKSNYRNYREQDMAKIRSAIREFSKQEKYTHGYDHVIEPMKDIIHDFEQEVLGYKCPQEIVDELTKEPEYDARAAYESSYDYDYNYNNPYYPDSYDDEYDD